MAAPASTGGTRARKAQPEAPTAGENGAKVLTEQDLDERFELYNKAVEDEISGLRGEIGGIRTLLEKHDERAPEAARAGVEKAVEEEIIGFKNRMRYRARQTVHVMVPGSEGNLKKDIVHIAQGLTVGFVGGRRMGPLPFTGW